MAQQNLNFGTAASNDGEFLPTAFLKIQNNFTDLYNALGNPTGPLPGLAVGGVLQTLSLSTPLAWTTTPTLGIPGSVKGTLSLAGNSSGIVTLQPAAAAGGWTLTLPTSPGTSHYMLQTDGTGVSNWFANVVDASTVIASPAKFWNPTYFTNPGTAIIHSFNRVKVGTATLSTGDIPQTTPDWLESLGQTFSSAGQLTSINAIGQLGLVGAARTSDYRSWSGAASGGSQGVNGFGYNDDTVAGNPIAVGVFGCAIRKSGVGGITLNQFDCNNAGSVQDVTPFGGVVGNTTFACGFSAGSFSTLGTANVSAAAYIGSGTTAKFRKGIIAFNGALDGTVGGGGNGVAFEMARNMSLRWLNSTPTTDIEMWANASGLTLNSYVFLVPSASGATTPYNAIADSAGNSAILLGGGGGTPDHTSYYRNTTHTISDIAGANYTHNMDVNGFRVRSDISTPAGGTTNLGIRFGSANVMVAWGSGVPTLTAAQGSLYLRSDGVPYVNAAGSTGWVELTGSANVVAKLIGVNFNSANTDTSFTVVCPAGYTRYRVNSVTISNASHSLTTATVGLYTASGGGGTALITAATAVTVSATTDNTLNNVQVIATLAVACLVANEGTLFFRIQAAEGAAATADVTITLSFLP